MEIDEPFTSVDAFRSTWPEEDDTGGQVASAMDRWPSFRKSK
jgi:hypothetical protein